MSWAEITRLATPIDAPLRGTPFAYSFRFSFDPIIVELLKRHVPWQERAWDADATCWYTTAAHLDTLRRLALTCKDATLVEGNRTTDLHTGNTRTQLDLFGG